MFKLGAAGVFLMVVALLAPAAAPAAAQTGGAVPGTVAAGETKWIDAWGVSFLPTTVNGTVQTQQVFANQTLRVNVYAKLGGSQARVKFSNKFTTVPLVIAGAHVARRTSGGAIDPATDRVLTFKGEKKVTIPAGEEMWSDAAALEIPQHTDVAISVYIADSYKPTLER